MDCRKNGFLKFFFLLIFPLYIHRNLRKEKCSSFSSSTQWDTANLKNFSLGLESLAPLLVVSKSKGIKRQIHVQDKKENSPFCCCHEAEIDKMGRQGCPAVTFLLRWTPKLICLMATILPRVTMRRAKREPGSVLLSFHCADDASGCRVLL